MGAPADTDDWNWERLIETWHPGQVVGWASRHFFDAVVVQRQLVDSGPTLDPYEVLQVAPEADDAEIRQAYRRRALATHPDKPAGDAQQFKCVAEAYATLNDPKKRAVHEARLMPQPVAPLVYFRLRPMRHVLAGIGADCLSLQSSILQRIDMATKCAHSFVSSAAGADHAGYRRPAHAPSQWAEHGKASRDCVCHGHGITECESDVAGWQSQGQRIQVHRSCGSTSNIRDVDRSSITRQALLEFL